MQSLQETMTSLTDGNPRGGWQSDAIVHVCSAIWFQKRQRDMPSTRIQVDMGGWPAYLKSTHVLPGLSLPPHPSSELFGAETDLLTSCTKMVDYKQDAFMPLLQVPSLQGQKGSC